MLSQEEISLLLEAHTGVSEIGGLRPIGAGCADQAIKIENSEGHFFLKYYSSQSSKEEADGLQLLRSASSFYIPEVFGYGKVRNYDYLLLEWIEPGQMSGFYWKQLAENLAELHSKSSKTYGLEHDNYIGKLPQTNTQKDDWIDFFIQCRLVPQLKLAENKLTKNTLLLFERLFQKLPDLLPNEKPSLLHGDLWRGNVLVNGHGIPALIDPAVYFGNREIELAFTYLFGGFDQKFYKTYSSILPLQEGFEKRIDLYNLYPLLAHVNMFGGGYITQVEKILKSHIQ